MEIDIEILKKKWKPVIDIMKNNKTEEEKAIFLQKVYDFGADEMFSFQIIMGKLYGDYNIENYEEVCPLWKNYVNSTEEHYTTNYYNKFIKSFLRKQKLQKLQKLNGNKY